MADYVFFFNSQRSVRDGRGRFSSQSWRLCTSECRNKRRSQLLSLVFTVISKVRMGIGHIDRPQWQLYCYIVVFLHWSNWDYGLTFKFSTPHLVPAYSEYMFGVGLCFSAYSVQWLKTKVVGVGVCVNFIIIINCFSKFWQPIWWFAAARAHHSRRLDLCNPSQSTKNNLLEGDQNLFCQSIQ